MQKFSYDEMDQSISTFLDACKKIRDDRQKDYGFHFYDNYNKFGLLGFLVNDNEITARLEQIDAKIRSDEAYDYAEAESRLQNALYDGINYRLLLLFWLNREKWVPSHAVSRALSGTCGEQLWNEVAEFNDTDKVKFIGED